MARLDEIAEGVATILTTSPNPEPLNVSLKGEGAVETTFLVRAVINSCERRGAPLSVVRLGIEIGADLIKQYGANPVGYQGVGIEGSHKLGTDIEFYRFQPRSD